MVSLSALLGSIPSYAWTMFAVSAGAGVALSVFPYVRRVFHYWRLERRLTRDPYMLREEMREYEAAMGGELEPFDLRRILGASLAAGLLAGLPEWLMELGLADWWFAAFATVAAGSLLFSIWRWFNDPEPEPVFLLPVELPRVVTAVLGAVGIVAGLILLAIWFF